MSDAIDLINYQSILETNTGMDDDLSIDTNDVTSLFSTSDGSSDWKLWNTSDRCRTLRFIIANDIIFQHEHINDNENEFPHFDQQDMSDITRNYMDPQTMIDLILDFYKQSKTSLRFIGFKNGSVRFLNEFYYPDGEGSKRQAFVVLDVDGTIRGVLFAPDLAGTVRTIFDVSDKRTEWEVKKHMENFYRTNAVSSHLPQETRALNIPQEPSNDTLIDDMGTVPNGFNPANLPPSEQNMESESDSSQTPQQMAPVHHTSQSNGLNDAPETGEPSNRLGLSASAGVSSPTQTRQNNSSQISYATPEIQIQPKQDWKLVYAKDLIPKLRKTVAKKPEKRPRKQKTKVNKGTKTKFIGLVQGTGNQRTWPRVKVPAQGDKEIYLACEPRTIANEHNSLKVIVPEKTTVDNGDYNKDNDLRFLRFNECDPNHIVDRDRGIVYMKVTAREHRRRSKKILIYMFNLYQTQKLTKDMIRGEHLEQCRLAFWFAINENGNFTRVSPESLSNTISKK